MKPLALLIALFVVIVGVVGIVAPDRLVALGHQLITPSGLYVIGALRVAIGLVLILAAPASRAPRTLRALGAVVVIAGLATPLFGFVVGVGRMRAILDWEAQRSTLIRLAGGFAIALGTWLGVVVGTDRR